MRSGRNRNRTQAGVPLKSERGAGISRSALMFSQRYNHMRRKLQWLLISRLVIAAGLLAIMGLTEQAQTAPPFVPLLAALAFATAILSVFYFAVTTRT